MAARRGRYTRGMTVAAVILSATAEGALADTLGQPRVRRLADIAWSGGALPVVVVAPDPDGAVAAALVGSEAVYGCPAPPEAGPVGQMVRGAELALGRGPRHDRGPVWPARMTWVGPETVTSLIEAHGTDPRHDAPTGLAGRARLAGPAAARAPRRAARGRRPTGCRRTSSTTSPPRSRPRRRGRRPGRRPRRRRPPSRDLPPYEGPPDPPAGHTHEWGDDVAAEAGLEPRPDAVPARRPTRRSVRHGRRP